MFHQTAPVQPEFPATHVHILWLQRQRLTKRVPVPARVKNNGYARSSIFAAVTLESVENRAIERVPTRDGILITQCIDSGIEDFFSLEAICHTLLSRMLIFPDFVLPGGMTL